MKKRLKKNLKIKKIIKEIPIHRLVEEPCLVRNEDFIIESIRKVRKEGAEKETIEIEEKEETIKRRKRTFKK